MSKQTRMESDCAREAQRNFTLIKEVRFGFYQQRINKPSPQIHHCKSGKWWQFFCVFSLAHKREEQTATNRLNRTKLIGSWKTSFHYRTMESSLPLDLNNEDSDLNIEHRQMSDTSVTLKSEIAWCGKNHNEDETWRQLICQTKVPRHISRASAAAVKNQITRVNDDWEELCECWWHEKFFGGKENSSSLGLFRYHLMRTPLSWYEQNIDKTRNYHQTPPVRLIWNFPTSNSTINQSS